MAIYLDANVLPADSHISSLGFSAIRAVARASNQVILAPELVIEEAVARREREIADSQREVRQIWERWRRMGIDIAPPAIEDSRTLANIWKAELLSAVTSLPTSPEAFGEGIRREVWRIPPARDGRGARDAVIWVTILAHHRELSEQSFFVTQNTKDFADPGTRDQFHPALIEEVRSLSTPLIYCNSPTHLLTRLAASVESNPTVDSLANSSAVIDAVATYIAGQDFLGSVLAATPNVQFIAGPIDSMPVSVSTGLSYRAAESEISVAWTRWRIQFMLGILSTHGNRSFSQDLRPIALDLDLQLWLRRSSECSSWSEAEVSARNVIEIRRG